MWRQGAIARINTKLERSGTTIDVDFFCVTAASYEDEHGDRRNAKKAIEKKTPVNCGTKVYLTVEALPKAGGILAGTERRDKRRPFKGEGFF